jgi:P27 family predicted phage terminase small subunit
MPRTGRPPKPFEQKRDEGTLRARDKQTPLLVAGRGTPAPSAYLTAGQVARFHALVAELSDAGYLDLADRGMLELAAIEEDNVDVCNQDIDRNGVVITGAMGGTIANPAVTARSKSLTNLRQLYAELGIGPASRARMNSLGLAGRSPAKTLPGVDAAPTPLRVVSGG